MSRILIVDDEKSIRRAFKSFLQEAGYDVTTVECLQAALDLLQGGGFDAVISDIVMPEISGVELLKRIHAGDPSLQVIMITGEPSQETAADSVRAGAADYLIKPVTKPMLLQSVTRVMRLRELELANRHYREELERLVEERTRQLSLALEDLKKAHTAMVRQERLNALGQMAAGIAHDFNNALMAIKGFADVLHVQFSKRANSADILECLGEIISAADDAADVVRRLRQFYKPDEGLLYSTVQLMPLVERVRDTTRPRWQAAAAVAGAVIDFQIALDDLPPVAAEESELREVLTNLVLNAVDAMPQGGVLRIDAAVRRNQVVLAVRDNGQGMTENVRNRCMEPFFTTKGLQGSGLGLSICHGIINRHGGMIDVESAPGQGTVLYISLRRAEAAADKSEPGATGDDDLAPLDVLVVDDDETVCRLLQLFLVQDGHRVKTVVSGEAACRQLDSAQFDLVITDRAMGAVTGDEVAAKARKSNPRSRVIMLTGFGDLMAAQQEKPAGVDLVMCKPVDNRSLRNAINQVLR